MKTVETTMTFIMHDEPVGMNTLDIDDLKNIMDYTCTLTGMMSVGWVVPYQMLFNELRGVSVGSMIFGSPVIAITDGGQPVLLCAPNINHSPNTLAK